MADVIPRYVFGVPPIPLSREPVIDLQIALCPPMWNCRPLDFMAEILETTAALRIATRRSAALGGWVKSAQEVPVSGHDLRPLDRVGEREAVIHE